MLTICMRADISEVQPGIWQVDYMYEGRYSRGTTWNLTCWLYVWGQIFQRYNLEFDMLTMYEGRYPPPPLFVKLGGGNQPLKYRDIDQMLNRICTFRTWNRNLFHTHSFRIGRATSWAQLGFTNEQILNMGRWRSDAYKKYIRPSMVLLHWANGYRLCWGVNVAFVWCFVH